MAINLGDIYEKICLYEDTVKTTVQAVEDGVCDEVLGMVSSTVNKIEKLTPRQSAWHASTPAKSSKIIA